MKMFSTWLILLQISSGISKNMKPILESSTSHLCPGDNVTYTCQANNVSLMSWSAEPHFSSVSPFTYSPSFIASNQENSYMGLFFGNVTNFKGNINNTGIADTITTAMTVTTSGELNGTNITCSIRDRQNNKFCSSSLLYIISVPTISGKSLLRKMRTEYKVTVELELVEMFDGAGVDHYIIELDNGTQLQTTNSSYSINIMYNTTLSVNISAHNCAGYSPFFPLMIQSCIPDEENSSDVNKTANTTSKDDSIFISGASSPTLFAETQKTPLFQDTFLLPVTITSCIVLILLILVVLVFLFNVWRCVRKRSRKYKAHFIRRVEINGNDEEHSEGTSVLPVYSYVPVRRDISDRDCTGQIHTVVNSINTSQNFIGMYAELQPSGMYTEVEPTQFNALPPPTIGNENVEYTMPDVSKLVEKERSNEEDVADKVISAPRKDDMHPLDMEINAHLILLQLGSVRDSWRALGQAAGMDGEMLNSVDEELSDDSGKLAEVVFYWVDRIKKVYWSDVAQLCEQIGYNRISEAINNAYITGVLPVLDTPDAVPFKTKATLPPTIPPPIGGDDDEKSPPVPPHQGRRRCEKTPAVPTMLFQDERSPKTLSCDGECDEGSPPPPPLPPPLAPGDIDF